MVETVQSHEGYVTMEDMTQYKVMSPEPTSTLYQKYHVLTTGAEWGGAELVEKLNLMELAGIGESTDTYLTNATKLFWLASITRLSSFISFFTHAVPNGKQLLKEQLGIDADYSYRKTKDSAEELWDKIASPEKMKDVNDVMREMLANAEMDVEQHQRGSSGVVAVDSAGNVCSLVHGSDSESWGTGLLVHGVSLPSSGIALKALIKGTKSGRRVPSEFQPVIVFEEEPRKFDGFGRRLKRDILAAKKNKKQLASKKKGFSNRQKNWEDARQKLVVFRTRNRVRSQLLEQLLTRSSQRGKSQERHQLGRVEKPVDELEQKEYREDGPSNLPANEININGPSQERDRTETPSEVSGQSKLSKHTEPSTPPTKELEELLHPTDSHRNHHTEEEDTNVSENPTNNQEEGEREESELDEEIIETGEPTEGEATREEEVIDEDEVKEFPHLGIPDVWRSGSVPDLVGESMLHHGPLVPVLAVTCTGPSQPVVIPQYLTSILDSGMNPKAALEAPTFLAPSPHSFQQDIQVEKFAIDENVLLDVKELGQPFTEVDSHTTEEMAGIGAAVKLNSDRKMLGCTHPFKDGFVEGVSHLEGL